MGGTASLRAALGGPAPLTSQQISDFLSTSDTSDTAISYEMQAIWDLVTKSSSQRSKMGDNQEKSYIFEQLLLRNYFLKGGKIDLPGECLIM